MGFICGDIFLSRNDSRLSRLIRWFEQLQTGDAQWSHAGVFIGSDMIIEALWHVRCNSWKKYAKETSEVWRLPLSEEDRDSFYEGMLQLAGNNYGLLKLPLFALDGVCSWAKRLMFKNPKPCFWFSKTCGVFNIQVCSQLVVYGLHKFTNYRITDANHIEVGWKEVSPDYLSDLLHMPHNKAKKLL